MSDIILHHYVPSPFSEKVRVALGIKRATWRGVDIPMVMPKPDLMPLTGGYRRTPVMQIGADIYCDTQCILRELDRRLPEPRLVTPESEMAGYAADRQFFFAAVGVVWGLAGSGLPAALIEDRRKFSGRDFDPAAMARALPGQLDQVRAMAHWVDQALADGRPFLLGARPSSADLSVYHGFWFLGRIPEKHRPFGGTSRLVPWMARLAGFGHGQTSAATAAEALDIAKAATPTTVAAEDPHDPSGRRTGQRVTVTPDDVGRDPVAGSIVRLDAAEIVIARDDPRVGTVHVHFPRTGFVVMPG